MQDAESSTAPASRDAGIIALVSGGHFFSHFYLLALPPLFPILNAELGWSYTALGALVSAYALAGGVGQLPSGFVVDRHGARRILLGGITLMAASVGLMAFAPGYTVLLGLAFLAGLGNSVFHPADYAILNARVSRRRMGRAFSLHTFSGFVGFAAAPLVMVPLAQSLGWQTALGVAGLAGLVMAGVMAAFRGALDNGVTAAARTAEPKSLRADLRSVLTPGIVLLVLFFTVNAMTTVGINSQSISALVARFGVEVGDARYGLTAYLLLASAGILAGGIVADRTRRYGLVTGAAFLTAAAALAAVGLLPLPFPAVVAGMALAGFMVGVMIPSRDMMVRAVAPPGTMGKVYGLMSTGIEIAAVASPLMMGWFVDQGMPSAVFIACAVLLLGSFLCSQAAARMVGARSAPQGAAAQ